MISTGGHALSFDIQHIIHSCFRSLVEAKARYFMGWSWTLLWVHHVCGCLSQHQNTFALRPSGTPMPPPAMSSRWSTGTTTSGGWLAPARATLGAMASSCAGAGPRGRGATPGTPTCTRPQWPNKTVRRRRTNISVGKRTLRKLNSQTKHNPDGTHGPDTYECIKHNLNMEQKAVLAANWAMSLEVLQRMGPGQACVVSDDRRHAGRTALHMAVWSKPRDTAEDLYRAFLEELVVKAPSHGPLCPLFAQVLVMSRINAAMRCLGGRRRNSFRVPFDFRRGARRVGAMGLPPAVILGIASAEVAYTHRYPQAKRSLNWYSHQGATALMMAVTQGNVIAVRVLLSAGAGGTSAVVLALLASLPWRT